MRESRSEHGTERKKIPEEQACAILALTSVPEKCHFLMLTGFLVVSSLVNPVRAQGLGSISFVPFSAILPDDLFYSFMPETNVVKQQMDYI